AWHGATTFYSAWIVFLSAFPARSAVNWSGVSLETENSQLEIQHLVIRARLLDALIEARNQVAALVREKPDGRDLALLKGLVGIERETEPVRLAFDLRVAPQLRAGSTGTQALQLIKHLGAGAVRGTGQRGIQLHKRLPDRGQ